MAVNGGVPRSSASGVQAEARGRLGRMGPARALRLGSFAVAAAFPRRCTRRTAGFAGSRAWVKFSGPLSGAWEPRRFSDFGPGGDMRAGA
jgi:hypothetical protein